MKKKIGIISLLSLISIIAIIPQSYGALASKPTTVTNGSNVLVNTTVSNSYSLCQQMTRSGESLYGTTVQPHLATNKDWGAVSYLSNSIYGTNTQGQNTGTQITINGVNYYSTTGNASGVMNWGAHPNKSLYTQTSALIKAYMNLSDTTTSSAHDNVTELETAVNNNSNYVEVIDTKTGGFNERTDGMALSEITNYSFVDLKDVRISTVHPISIRKGLFGFRVSGYDRNQPSDGAAYGDTTFRPVVWN